METWIGPSFSITPTGALGRPGIGRWWRLTMFRPSTKTRSRLGSMRMTLPVLPLSLPAMTTTSSSVRMLASQSTSGASETIFMKPPSRSSRATGPKMRVPRGLFWASMITAAFSSKAM